MAFRLQLLVLGWGHRWPFNENEINIDPFHAFKYV